MRSKQRFEEAPSFVELPTGIFTADGTWFHTSITDLRSFAGPVLDRLSAEAMFGQASVWLRSPVTLSIFLLPALLYVTAPFVAILVMISFFVLWGSFGQLMLMPSVTPALGLGESIPFQALYYVVSLSFLGSGGHALAVWVGLGAFILLRWGVLEKILAPLVERLHRTWSAIPAPDTILRILLVRSAMSAGITLDATSDYESRILDIWNARKRKS